MRKVLMLPLAVGAAALVGPSASPSFAGSRTTYRLAASMNAHQVVTPRNKRWKPPAKVAKAHGSFAGTLTVSGKTRRLRWRITYVRVGSSPLKIVDVHYGKPGRFGPIVVRLCGPCKSGQRGTKKLTASAALSIRKGTSWVTVITGTYPNGVIRGQIKVSRP